MKTQGRRGEVAVELHTDFPERFAERRRIYALGRNGERRQLQLESFWPHQERYVLKFAGVDSMDQAEDLVGSELQIHKDEREKLEPGSAYTSDLVGCVVWTVSTERELKLGQVAEVQFGTGEAPLLIVREGAAEYLLPFAAEYLEGMDLERKCIRMRLPEGLLEVNAPLSEDEKRQFASSKPRPRREQK